MGYIVGIDPAQLADAEDVAGKLQLLPKDALMYIAGFVEGYIAKADRAAHDSRGDTNGTDQ